eukprot:1229410-Rhodomonas_salina.1
MKIFALCALFGPPPPKSYCPHPTTAPHSVPRPSLLACSFLSLAPPSLSRQQRGRNARGRKGLYRRGWQRGRKRQFRPGTHPPRRCRTCRSTH